MSEVVEINDLGSLAGCRLLWNSLFAATPDATYFQTLDWLENYWRHFGEGKRLRVLVVRAAGQPIGILPLCVETRRHRLATLRVLTYPLDDWGTFFGPIGPNPTATLIAAMRHIATTPHDWDQIDLPWIANEAKDGERTARALQFVGLHAETESHGSTSMIDLADAGAWENYLRKLPRKMRQGWQRTVRRVAEWGGVEFERYRPDALRAGDGEPRWDLYEQCEEVARASWQASSTNGNTLCHPGLNAFYRDSHEVATRLGMADVAVLRIAGRPVAFWYGTHYQGHVSGLRMGYVPDSPVSGVGMALLARVIEDSFSRCDQQFDLGPGDEKYKERIRTHRVERHRVTHVPATAWRPQLVRAARWFQRRGSEPASSAN
jgi:CelD/BcsL family acetyltransferase involved in cellulose biosynthesis